MESRYLMASPDENEPYPRQDRERRFQIVDAAER